MAIFVVQEHHATRLHWDFRLEIDGVLKSWAIPKGPTLDPREKHLAIQVPDHDMGHAKYEGIIPAGSYGAGPVLIWDKGTFQIADGQDPLSAWKKGSLKFILKGKILKGEFALVRMYMPGKKNTWLLMKKKDEASKAGWKMQELLTPAVEKKMKVKAPACSTKE